MKIFASAPAFRLITAALLSTSAAPAAFAQVAPEAAEYNLPASDLGDSLRAFAQISGKQILFSEELVRGRRSAPLFGRYTVRDALRVLIGDAPLRLERTGMNVLMLRPAAQPISYTQSAPEPAPAQSVPEPVAAESTAETLTPDIVVTARRRQERAQDIPIALSVVSGEVLERTGNVNLAQISSLTPSVTIQQGNARNTFVNIRGLGSNSDQADGLEIGVGIYIDDVYYGRVGSSQFDLIDIERFEVLRGPQGTLFGKNTTAGALNITTRLPSFTPEFRGELSLGEHGYHQVRASASGPILGDKIAARITASETHTDGHLLNVFNNRKIIGSDNQTVRAQLLANPSDAISIRLIGDYARQVASTPTRILGIFTRFANGARISNNFLDRAARAGYVVPYDLNDRFDRRIDIDAPNRTDMEGYGLSAKVDWDLGAAALTSVTAYRGWDWAPVQDQDATRLSINARNGTANRQRQFSQELRIASQGVRTIDYVAGLYYFSQPLTALSQRQLGPDYAIWNSPNTNRALTIYAYDGFQSNEYIEADTKSYAAFGQVNWNVSDALKLTGGLRYTHEKKTGSYDVRTVAGNNLALLSATDRAAAQALRDNVHPEEGYSASLKDNSLTGQINLAYKLTDDVLAYANYSRGSKSGGFSLSELPAGISPVIKPETVDAYEVGLKTQFWDRRITFNTAAFWTEVKNYQAAISENIGNTTAIRRYISNIPGVRSRGFEADLTVVANEYVRFTASGAYTDASYKSYTNAGAAPEGRNVSPIQDLSGVQVANAPKYVYSLSTDLNYPVSATSEVYGRFDYSYRSSQNSSASNSRYTLVPGFGVLNGRIGFRLDEGRFDLAVWARNLLNKDYVTRLIAANDGRITGYLGDPRSVGVTARVQF